MSEQWVRVMKAYLYILQSLKNNSYYVGSTTNINQRLSFHNNGYVKSTKNKRPYELVFTQEFEDIKTAHKAEIKIKGWKRKDFIEKIIKDGKLKIAGRLAQW